MPYVYLWNFIGRYWFEIEEISRDNKRQVHRKKNPAKNIWSHCVVWYLLFLRDSIFGSLNYGITSFITALFLSVNDLFKKTQFHIEMKSFIKGHSNFHYDALTIFLWFFYQDSVEIPVEVKKEEFLVAKKGHNNTPSSNISLHCGCLWYPSAKL